MPNETIKIEWKCDSCGKSGIAEMPKHIGFWDGLREINKSHKETSPSCEGSFYKDLKVKLIEENKQVET